MGPSMCILWMVVQSPEAPGGCPLDAGVENPLSSFSPFSNSYIKDLMLTPMVGCKHLPLYLSGSGRSSQETDITGSCQQALLGIHNSVWVCCLYMEWIPRWDSLWMPFPSASALHFVSIFAPMSILFHFLRTEAPTLWSFFLLSFMWSVS